MLVLQLLVLAILLLNGLAIGLILFWKPRQVPMGWSSPTVQKAILQQRERRKATVNSDEEVARRELDAQDGGRFARPLEP